MMDAKPSINACKKVPRLGRICSALVVGMALSGCVSQSDVFSVSASGQTPSPQLSLSSDQNTDPNSLDVSLAPNIPQPAPRAVTVSDGQILQSSTPTPTTAATDSTLAETQSAPTSETVLAAVDPNVAATPAESVINSATASDAAGTETNNTVETTPEASNTVEDNAALTTPEPVQPVAVEKPKATGLLARLFQNSDKPKTSRAKKNNAGSRSVGRGGDDGGVRIASAHATAKKKKSVRQTVTLRRNNANGALPGVKSTSQLFGVTEDNGTQDTAAPNVTQVAAVGSLGLVSPNGIRVQHSKVQVSCLKPGIIRMLKQVERRYGRKPIVTSGYRSPKRNRRAGGAKNSMHIYCKAADIQVEGVSKWQLAKYLRTVPGRGGVGTYCRTKSVHIDTGSVRDWHHPCRRSSKRKKRKT